jgi:hypothetical protein
MAINDQLPYAADSLPNHQPPAAVRVRRILKRPSRRPSSDHDRPSCPRCGQRVDACTTVKAGDVRSPFAVTMRCPFTRPREGGGVEGCRQPTAVLFDKYGYRYLFAPTFEALNDLIKREQPA